MITKTKEVIICTICVYIFIYREREILPIVHCLLQYIEQSKQTLINYDGNPMWYTQESQLEDKAREAARTGGAKCGGDTRYDTQKCLENDGKGVRKEVSTKKVTGGSRI